MTPADLQILLQHCEGATPTCLLRKGTDKVHVLDRKDFDGGIVADIEDAMRFIERNTRTAYRIDGLRRHTSRNTR